jgi:hypothetical protein
MRTLLMTTALLIAIAFVPSKASGASIGIKDTFQDGTTDGWFAGGGPGGGVPPVPPHVVATGGPEGAGDQFLQITSNGVTGTPGSRLVALNAAQWAGDYLAAGITAIGMDLKNLGPTQLTIRLLFEDPIPGPPANEGVTTVGVVLPVGSDWTHVAFAISPADLTMFFGSANAVLHNTTVLRIIDSPTPVEPVTILGQLGVDNIEATGAAAAAVPEPATVLLTSTGLAALSARYRRRRTD